MTKEPLLEQFEATFGVPAEVDASAPGRVNIIGEHIDYSDGWVLPFAIDYRTRVLIRRRNDDLVQIASKQRPGQILRYTATELLPINDWADYVAGVLYALDVNVGCDILVDGQVPVGAGLSSSAALECAVAIGLNQLLHLGFTGAELARAAQQAENKFVGMPCGIMDQAVSVLAEPGHAVLLDCRSLETTQIPLRLHAAGLVLLVIDTQAHHALVDGGYAARRASCEAVAARFGVAALRDASLAQLQANRSLLDDVSYRRALHALTEMDRVHEAVAALRNDDYEALGRLLTESHESLRDDYNVSCAELDTAVAAALAAGALGARMVGGGFGGSAIALLRQDQVAEVEAAVAAAFSANGFTAPRFFVAETSGGAHAELLTAQG